MEVTAAEGSRNGDDCRQYVERGQRVPIVWQWWRRRPPPQINLLRDHLTRWYLRWSTIMKFEESLDLLNYVDSSFEGPALYLEVTKIFPLDVNLLPQLTMQEGGLGILL